MDERVLQGQILEDKLDVQLGVYVMILCYV